MTPCIHKVNNAFLAIIGIALIFIGAAIIDDGKASRFFYGYVIDFGEERYYVGLIFMVIGVVVIYAAYASFRNKCMGDDRK